MTPGSSQSTVHYDFLIGDTLFTKAAFYVFSFEITKAGRSRRCKPEIYYVNNAGEPA